MKPDIGPEPEAGSSKVTAAAKKQFLASLPKKKRSIRMKEKRIRDNHRLRKLVTPKHALLAINELKGVSISEFTYTPVQGNQSSFIAEATINGKVYNGKGRSKNASKTDVCDQALRDIMIQKMKATSKAVEENAEVTPEDEVPIVTLVSYAIHKLFADWEAEGVCLKCAGSKTNPAKEQCTCTSGQSRNLQETLAAIVAPCPADGDQDMEDVDDD